MRRSSPKPGLAPDFVYEDSELPDHAGDSYRGLDGLRRAWTGFVEPFEQITYDLERIVGSSDRFVSIHRVRSTARYTGIVQESRWAYCWTYRDGLLVHARAFLNPDQAMRTAGL